MRDDSIETSEDMARPWTGNTRSQTDPEARSLPEPEVVRLPDDDGLSDETGHIWAWHAHGHDTGMQPYFSAQQMHAYALEAIRSHEAARGAQPEQLAQDWGQYEIRNIAFLSGEMTLRRIDGNREIPQFVESGMVVTVRTRDEKGGA